MPVDPTLLTMLRQTCDVEQLVRDSNGDVTTSSSWIGLACAMEANSSTIVDANGEAAKSKALLFLGPDPELDHTHPNWRVTIDGVDYTVLQIAPVRDKTRDEVHHYELMLR